MKTNKNLLKYAKEGDEFVFFKNGTINPTRYIVEGQYPKFGCTTVSRVDKIKSHITHGRTLGPVTAVENNQEIRMLAEGRYELHHCILQRN